jgi:hypothetical protein
MANNNNFLEIKTLLSSGNNRLKKKNAVGIIPEVAKPILPQNSID